MGNNGEATKKAYDYDLLKCDQKATENLRYDVERGYTFLKLDKTDDAKKVFEQISNQYPGYYCGWFGLAAVATKNFIPVDLFANGALIREAEGYLETAKKVAPSEIVKMIDAFFDEYKELCAYAFRNSVLSKIKYFYGNILKLKEEFEHIPADDWEFYDEYEVYNIAQTFESIGIGVNDLYYKTKNNHPICNTLWCQLTQAFLLKVQEYFKLNEKASEAQEEWYRNISRQAASAAFSSSFYIQDEVDKSYMFSETRGKRMAELEKTKKTDYQIIIWKLPSPAEITLQNIQDYKNNTGFSEVETEIITKIVEMAAIMRLKIDDQLKAVLPKSAVTSYENMATQAANTDAVYQKKIAALNEERKIEREKYEKKRKTKRRIRNVIILIILIAVLGAAYYFIGIPSWVEPAREYQRATELMESGNYSEASKIFSLLTYREIKTNGSIHFDIKEYKDSKKLAEKCKALSLKNASVGDNVFLGRYTGETNSFYDPVEWLVLDKQDGKLLLITKYAYDMGWWNGSSWKYSRLRENLNESFYSTSHFSEEEKQWICLTENTTTPNPISETDSGGPTEDYIFVLSYYEAYEYFPDNDSRIAYSPKDRNTPVTWYLRTVGLNSSLICAVYTNGVIDCGENGYDYNNTNSYVRPVMWVTIPD